MSDLKFLLLEIREVLVKNRKCIPEDTYKVLFDYLFHAINILNESEDNK